MRFSQPLIPGTLLRRYKRFLADVRLEDGREVVVHCTNTGRMTGCSDPGSNVYISHSSNPKRKLAYTLELVKSGETWIGVNTMNPNRVIAEALAQGRIPELTAYPTIKREVRFGAKHRLDFCLEGRRGLCYVEVKNVTLAAPIIAYFPDAITTRGTSHLLALQEALQAGHRAVILFLVQREDCFVFRPAAHIDATYAATLEMVNKAGVEVLVYVARVTPDEIALLRRIPYFGGINRDLDKVFP